MKKLTLITALFFSLLGCKKEDFEEMQAGANCDVNHTAVVKFENRSTSGTSYDVYWNNVRVKNNLMPGEKSKAEAYSAGNQTYVFKIAGTNQLACQAGYPNLAQCQSYTFWCEQ